MTTRFAIVNDISVEFIGVDPIDYFDQLEIGDELMERMPSPAGATHSVEIIESWDGPVGTDGGNCKIASLYLRPRSMRSKRKIQFNV